LLRRKVGDYLMAEQVEVDPLIGATAFRAAEQSAVEPPRSGKVIDWKSEMKGRNAHLLAVRWRVSIVEAFVSQQ